MHFRDLLVVMLLVSAMPAMAQQKPDAGLREIHFNLYTDSIKTIMDFYVNVEGTYRDGHVLPLDTNEVIITADQGTMIGNAWRAPQSISFEKVHFKVRAKRQPALHDSITVWLKRGHDPRDTE